jgi:hypothetical protein
MLDRDASARRGGRRRWAALVPHAAVAMLFLTVVGYLTLVTTGTLPPDRRLGTPELVLGAGTFLFVVMFETYSFEDLSIGVTGVRAKLARLDKNQRDIEASIGSIREEIAALFLTSLAPTLYEKLDGVVAGKEFRYDWNESLAREVVLMRDLGFIEDFDPESLKHGANLTSLLVPTAQGKRFVKARRQLNADRFRALEGPTAPRR